MERGESEPAQINTMWVKVCVGKGDKISTHSKDECMCGKRKMSTKTMCACWKGKPSASTQYYYTLNSVGTD